MGGSDAVALRGPTAGRVDVLPPPVVRPSVAPAFVAPAFVVRPPAVSLSAVSLSAVSLSAVSLSAVSLSAVSLSAVALPALPLLAELLLAVSLPGGAGHAFEGRCVDGCLRSPASSDGVAVVALDRSRSMRSARRLGSFRSRKKSTTNAKASPSETRLRWSMPTRSQARCQSCRVRRVVQSVSGWRSSRSWRTSSSRRET